MKESNEKKHQRLAERWCEIFSVLYQGVTIDKNWMCERFGITERTAYRDFARLGTMLDEEAPGRYKLNPRMLPTLHPGHLEEFARFAGVAHLFPRSDGHSLRNSLKQRDHVAIVGASSRENGKIASVLNRLEAAIAASHEVHYHYRQKDRNVQPYRLINQHGLWYLAAVEQGVLKAYELARIEQLHVSDLRFVRDAQVILELDESNGIRFGRATPTTLEVSARAAEFVTRRPLFPGQQITDSHDDGSLTLVTATRDTDSLFRWLRYWLPEIAIVSPVSLRDAFASDLQARCASAVPALPESTVLLAE